MMNPTIISLIIPFFNSEKTLGKCIASVLLQTFTNFEVLLINDGSIDKSIAIANEFVSKDSRIKLYSLDNSGVSAARNFGIRNASGKLLAFIDSDDYITENYLQELLCKSEFDLSLGGTVLKFENKLNKIVIENTSTNRFYKDKEISEFLLSNMGTDFLRTCWGKLFRRDLIFKNEIFFNERLRLGEDTVFILEYLRFCHAIYVTNNCGYIYRVPEFNVNKFKLSPNDYIDLYNIQKEKALLLEKNIMFNPNHFLNVTSNILGFDMLRNLYLSNNYKIRQRAKYIELWKQSLNSRKIIGLPKNIKRIAYFLNILSIFMFLDFFLKLYFNLNYLKNR